MTAFTNETTVRTHTGLTDTTLVPSGLVTQRIGDAHNDILRDLKSEYLQSTDATLKTAETELAAAYLLRSLAAQAAFAEKSIRTPAFSEQVSRKSLNLREAADAEEQRAWGRLRPFLNEDHSRFGFAVVEPRSDGEKEAAS